jgi:hypothetical protein
MTSLRTLVSIPFLIFLLVGCGSDEDLCANPQVITNSSGLTHGMQCSSDDQCIYGFCFVDSVVTGGQFGICTKSCTGCVSSSCSDEGPGFTCLRGATDFPTHCVATCNSVEDCAAYGSGYAECIDGNLLANYPPWYTGTSSLTTRKICMAGE